MNNTTTYEFCQQAQNEDTTAEFPFIKKASAFLEKLVSKFRIPRIICCFLAILSTVGLVMYLSSGEALFSSIFMVVGLASALFACPGRFLGITAALTIGGFSIGLFFALVGCILGAGIGFALGVALLVYIPAAITIPYCFKELL